MFPVLKELFQIYLNISCYHVALHIAKKENTCEVNCLKWSTKLHILTLLNHFAVINAHVFPTQLTSSGLSRELVMHSHTLLYFLLSR